MLRGETHNKISMVEGDYGLSLPITIKGVTLGGKDKVNFYIKKNNDYEEVFKQTYENIENNTFNLILSKEESERLKVGIYKYVIDWYKEDEFYCNIIKGKEFQVEDKR